MISDQLPAPSRILFFRDGLWTDFPREALEVLAAGFAAGKTAFEVPVGGRSYLFDFLRMTRVDSESGASSSIAWIDADGRCFFPRTVVDEKSSSSSSSSGVSSEDSSGAREDYLSGESPEAARSGRLLKWPGTEVLKEEDRCYAVVAKLFLAGMRRFDPSTAIISVRRCLYSAPPRIGRLKAFQMQVEATRAARGRENVKFGWFAAASASDLAVVVSQGFGRTNSELLGRSGAHGIGIHLSPPHSPYPSKLLSGVDENGEGHILLCRVAMGRSEKVEAGSEQYYPSGEEFDSGVDDLANPKWYVVWSTHMNTHIIPEYVVSYRVSQLRSPGSKRLMSPTTTGRPQTSSLSFSKLFAEIARSLPSSMIRALEISYQQFREGKLSKEAFIRCLRSVAGDKLLTSSIKKIRGHP